MTGRVAFRGVGVDHLYPDCPSLQRSRNSRSWFAPIVGQRLQGLVDPEGSDVCGLCQMRWKRTR